MAATATSLVWSPTAQAIEDRVALGDDLILIISPFTRAEALQRLLTKQRNWGKLKIVVRWRPIDLVAGVSDLALYPFALKQGCQLYVNDLIHLKLFVFESNAVFSSSGNVTLSGLGYSERANIETGVMLQLGASDWVRIHSLIEASRRVDDEMFESLSRYLAMCPEPTHLPPPPVFPNRSKLFTIGSLPATESPQLLREYYLGRTLPSAEEERRVSHDMFAFMIPANLDAVAFEHALGASFKGLPFVKEFVKFLRYQGSLRFGAVNDWIHEKCEDVPLPYRWEIKENTRIFYNWLAHFVPEITWDVPGAHSQVIYWAASERESGTEIAEDETVKFQAQFASLLNREQAPEWNAISIGGAPHQPLLLLAVIEAYEREPERPNIVRLDDRLQKMFLSYFAATVASQRATSIPMPFIALRNEPFWELIRRNTDVDVPSHIRSQGVFDEHYEGARLDPDLHRLLTTAPGRLALQETLLQTYFPETTQAVLSGLISSRTG